MYITLIYQLRCNQIITLCKNKLKLSMYQSQCLSTTNCTNMIHQNYHEVIKDKKQFKSKEAYRLYLLKLDSEYQELLHQAFNKSCFNSLPLDLRETGYHDHLIKYFNTILEPKIENVNSISMEDPHSNNSNQNKVNIVDPFNPEYFVEGVKIYKSLYGDPWIHRNFKIDENDMNWPYHFRGFPLGRYVRIYRELRESKIYNERQLVNTGIQDELDKLHYIPSLKMTTFVLTITNILVYKELYGNYSVHNQFYIPNSKFYPIDDNKYIHNPFPKYSWVSFYTISCIISIII